VLAATTSSRRAAGRPGMLETLNPSAGFDGPVDGAVDSDPVPMMAPPIRPELRRRGGHSTRGQCRCAISYDRRRAD
jgi:hypothetical protein